MDLFVGTLLAARTWISWHEYQTRMSRVEVYTSDSDIAKEGHLRELVKDVLSKVPYRPTLYSLFDLHGQLQTAGQYFLRNTTRVLSFLVPHSHLYVKFRREIVQLADGGIVAIDWASLTGNHDEDDGKKPVMILHHGLVGDSQSEYIYHFIRQLIRHGYRVGVMIARGCGGLPLNNAFTFAGRKSCDIRAVVLLVKGRYPQAKLFWMGYSLGAAGTLQYVEDFHGQSEEEQSLLDAVMCVSPPWSFWVKKNPFDIWSMLMVVPMKMYMLKHNHVFKEEMDTHAVSLLKMLTIKDIFELNELCFHGFGGITQHGKNFLLERAKESGLMGQMQEELTLSSELDLTESLTTATLTTRDQAQTDKLPDEDTEEGSEAPGLRPNKRSIVSLQDLAEYEQQLQAEEASLQTHWESQDWSQQRPRNTSATSYSNTYRDSTAGEDANDTTGGTDDDRDSVAPSQQKTEKHNHGHSSRSNDRSSAENIRRLVSPEAIISAKASDELTRSMRKHLLKKYGTFQYKSVAEYYDDCSPVFRAHLISTPTLSISAKDDPICLHKDCPRRGRQIGPGLVVLKTQVGGHLAFPEDLLPLTHAWTDRVALEWFSRFL